MSVHVPANTTASAAAGDNDTAVAGAVAANGSSLWGPAANFLDEITTATTGLIICAPTSSSVSRASTALVPAQSFFGSLTSGLKGIFIVGNCGDRYISGEADYTLTQSSDFGAALEVGILVNVISISIIHLLVCSSSARTLVRAT
jgi:hypothetical protein